jgi:ABC-type multidrug transport system ATPase subunit
VFIETLTLQETVMIAAELKLPGSMSKAEKVARANEIIHEVGLTHAKNTKVGGPAVAGISGGEKRRLNIALELLSSPSKLHFLKIFARL